MKTINIEIGKFDITETKYEHDERIGKWLREIRLEEHSNESLEQIATAVGITVDDIVRCESGQDIPLYETEKLLNYYNPDHCACTITRS